MGSKLYARDMHCSRLAETGHVFTAAGQGYRLYRVVDETTGELENVGHYATWDAMVAAAQADTTFDTDERVSIGGEHPADDGHAYQIVTVGSVPHVRFMAMMEGANERHDTDHAYIIATIGRHGVGSGLWYVARCSCGWSSDQLTNTGLAHSAHTAHVENGEQA